MLPHDPAQPSPLSKFARVILALVLIGQSILLVLVASEARIPLPDFILASVRKTIRKVGLEISCESISFTLRGTLRAKRLILRTSNEEVPPLAKIDHFVMNCSPWDYLTGTNFVRNISIRGGEALYNETIETEPILTDLEIELTPLSDNHIAKSSCRLGAARVWLDAEADFAILFPERKGPPKTPLLKRHDFPELYASVTRILGHGKRSLQNARGSFISAKLSKNGDGHVFSFDSRAGEGTRVGGITFDQAMAHFTLRQQAERWLVDGRPEARIQKGRLSGHGGADNVNLRLDDANYTLQELGQNLRANLRLEGLEAVSPYDGRFESIDARIEIQELDRIKTECFAKANRFHLALRADYEISKQSGSVSGHGELFPEDLRSEHLRELARTNKLRAPAGITLLMAEASLGHKFAISQARLRATGRNITYRGVTVARASATTRYLMGGDWLLEPLAIDLGDSHARGSYHRRPTRDYRFLLQGAVRPEKFNPWMGDWWIRLWRDFEFGSSPPVGDFDVAGRWRDPSGSRRQLFGSAQFSSLAYRKLPVDTGRVKILADSNRTIARKLDLNLSRGWAKGDLSWETGSKGKEQIATRFSMEGSVVPSDCLEIFGPDTRKTLLKFESEAPIMIHADGVLRQEENASHLYLETNATKPLRYAKVPLKSLSFELRQEGTITKIDDLKFQFAEGLAKGSLVHSKKNGKKHLALDLELSGAERKHAIEALRLSKVFANPGGHEKIDVQSKAAGENPPDKDRSVLDFTLSAEGDPDDPLSFTGNGKIDLRDSDLGSIHIFGPLSETLGASPLPLPTGSVNFTRMATTYALDRSRATFDDLSIASSTALLRGKGELSLQDSVIAFKARMYLIGGLSSNIPILGKIADAIDPLSKFIELELNGSIENPQWSVGVEPKLLFDK